MLNLSELTTDPDFAQPFTIQRSQGAFALGGFESVTTTIPATGILRPAGEREIAMVPAGDRVTGMIAVLTAAPLYLTHPAPGPGLSDIVLWRGESYRILKLAPWEDFGFFKAIAVRTSGR